MTPEPADDTNESANLLDAIEANEALTLSLLRQHELTEAAELANTLLHAEIAARQKVEEALLNSEKLASAGRMAAVLAHEINNPLEAVTNLLYLAQTSDGIPGTVHQYLVDADSELRRIGHITRQTLGFYRDSAAPITFNVTSLLDSVLDVLQAKIVSKRAVIQKQCVPNLKMSAFQGEMRQVLSNLVMNSLDAVAEGGTITMRAAVSKQAANGRYVIRITVADNGLGIRREAFPQIFTPFFTTKGTVGNGLGLWVSKQLIEKHGGRIQVRSCVNAPRRGTTCSVVLPQNTM